MAEKLPDTSVGNKEGTESESEGQEGQINWRTEAVEVAKDIYSCVTSVGLSEELTARTPATAAYLNVRTLENKPLTVRVNSSGYTIVGNFPNDDSLEKSNSPNLISYETPYSLLHSISPLYSESFAAQLHQKLSRLVDKGKQGDPK